jgi:hypothetical protein
MHPNVMWAGILGRYLDIKCCVLISKQMNFVCELKWKESDCREMERDTMI